MVVRMRANRSKTGKRRSNKGLTGTRVGRCECGELRIPHRACANCGKYNGRVVIDVVARTKRDQRRAKRKQTDLRASGQESGKEKETANA